RKLSVTKTFPYSVMCLLLFTDPEDATQFGFGPFELPPQWLPETRNSKKRLLPPLGNTPEELIQTKQPRVRPERRISRNNKVSTFPNVDP
ncbi:hypothetical protein M9458_040404, partial [Cirrhinus mrigala]